MKAVDSRSQRVELVGSDSRSERDVVEQVGSDSRSECDEVEQVGWRVAVSTTRSVTRGQLEW